MAETTRRWPRALGWLAVLGAALALTIPAAAHAAYPGANGRIAFTVQTWRLPPPLEPSPPDFMHPGIPEEPVLVSARIESVLPNGKGRRRLHTFSTENTAYYGEPGTRPAFSPNGKLIAFEEGNRLAIVRHDGTGLRRLRQLSQSDQMPTWSPNGRRLAFSGLRPGLYNRSLYTVRQDGTGRREVIDYGADWPAWSVTGRFAFLNNDDQYRMTIGPRDGLYSIRDDGSRLRRLFGSFVALGNEPDWSPDGRRLAFRARGRIFTIGTDGRGRRPITGGNRPYSHPAWSPDGRYIAVIRGEERDQGLWVMRPDGRGLRQVVGARRTVSSDGQVMQWQTFGAPSWQPLRR
jgi:Tol biopolymer transport system component